MRDTAFRAKSLPCVKWQQNCSSACARYTRGTSQWLDEPSSTMISLPSSTDISSVLDQLARGPSLVRQVIYATPTALRKRRPAPGMWSAHEHAVHLAMVDPIM